MSARPSSTQDEGMTAAEMAQTNHPQQDDQHIQPSSSDLERDATGQSLATTAGCLERHHDFTPKKLPSGSLYGSSDDFSPTSTFGTTPSGSESVPATPLHDNFPAGDPDTPHVTSSEADDLEVEAESQVKSFDGNSSIRPPKPSPVGGVSLAQMKSDSCPDRLVSMMNDIDLHDESGSPDSLVTQIRKSLNASPAGTPLANEPSEEPVKDQYEPNHPAAETSAITAEKAQSIYPPEASVFVANLAKDHTDEELLAELQDLFGKFGACWILIRRDASIAHIPFAFVQYKTKEEAQIALKEGPGKLICGRACRVEASRAHRAVYVTRKDGKGPTLDEVKTLLQSYKTTEMWSPTRTEIEAYGLGSGIWVRFELFGECKDAVKEFRNNETYHLVYKDFDKRNKSSRTYESSFRTWRPRTQHPPPKHVVTLQARPWGSPYLSKATPAVDFHQGNTTWYNPYASAISTVPLPPMLSYAHATGQAAIPTTNSVLPLLQQHVQGVTPTSTPAFVAPSIYAVAHPAAAMYPQSPVSPVSPSHDHFFFSSPPVSPASAHGPGGVSTAFPAFHLGTTAGNVQAGLNYPSGTQYSSMHPANVFNGPRTVVSPLDTQANTMSARQSTYHENVFGTNTMVDTTSMPSTAVRAKAPSPFHDQLPLGYNAFPGQSNLAGGVNIASSQYETPSSPTAFGFDGTAPSTPPEDEVVNQPSHTNTGKVRKSKRSKRAKRRQDETTQVEAQHVADEA